MTGLYASRKAMELLVIDECIPLRSERGAVTGASIIRLADGGYALYNALGSREALPVTRPRLTAGRDMMVIELRTATGPRPVRIAPLGGLFDEAADGYAIDPDEEAE